MNLVERFDEMEFQYTCSRMHAFAATMGDPGAIEFIEGQHFRATLAKIPIPLFNRVIVSGPVEVGELTPVLERFQQRGVVPTLDVSAGALTAELSSWLGARGFVANSASQPIFVGRPVDFSLKATGPVECRRVLSAKDLVAFAEVYVRAWSIYDGVVATMKANIQRWPDLPGWQLFLAEVDGRPCGIAVLYEHEGAAYLADAATLAEARGRGVQSALLAIRLTEARRLGVGRVFARADLGSVSQRNLERAGLVLAYQRTSFSRPI